MPKKEGSAPPPKDRETPNTKDGQGKSAEKSSDRKNKENPGKKEGNHPPQERPKTFQIERSIDVEPKKVNTAKPIEYGDALLAAKVVADLRDLNDADPSARVVVTTGQYERLKGFLISAGYDLKDIERMHFNRVVNLVEEIFKGKRETVVVKTPTHSQKEEAADVVLGGKDATTLKLADQYIERAKDKREEDLTLEKLDKRFAVGEENMATVGKKAESLATKPDGVQQSAPSRGRLVVMPKGSPPLFTLSRSEVQNLTRGKTDERGNPIKLSIDWDSRNLAQRAVELFKKGVIESSQIPVIEGGATYWTSTGHPDSNDAVSYSEAFKRLGILDKEEDGDPHAVPPIVGVAVGALVADKQELIERLDVTREDFVNSLLSTAREYTYEVEAQEMTYILKQLTEIKTLERYLGGGGLPANIDQMRDRLIGRITESEHGAGLVIDELVRLNSIPPRPLGATGFVPGHRTFRDDDAITELNEVMSVLLDFTSDVSQWQGTDPATDVRHVWETRFAAPYGGPNLKPGFWRVHAIAKAIERAEWLHKGAGNEAALNSAISEDNRKIVKARDRKFLEYYAWKLKALPAKTRTEIFKALDQQAQGFESSAQFYGWSPGEFGRRVMEAASVQKEMSGFEGIMEWRAVGVADEYRRKIDDKNETGAPVDWRDSWRNSMNNLKYVESEDLPLENLKEALQKVAQIASNLGRVVGPDKLEADKVRERIEKVYRAVYAKVQEREALKSSSWDPEKVGQVYTSGLWEDDTHQVYFERFNEDDEGNKFKDGAGNEFNLLDKAMQVYFKHYAQEKRKLNMVEALTLRDLNEQINAGHVPSDIKALFKKDLSAAEVDMYNRVRKEMMIMGAVKSGQITLDNLRLTYGVEFHSMDDAQIDAAYAGLSAAASAAAINSWKGNGNKRGIITDWMTERTLLGATAERKVMWTDPSGETKPKSILDMRKLDIAQEMYGVLQGMGVSPTDLTRYRDFGLLKQASNVAYWETYAMGAPAMLGMMRIYDKEKEWYKNKFGSVKQVADVAYSNDSNFYFSRIVDDVFVYYVDEARGKTGGGYDVAMNATHLWQKNMLGKRHGFLPQNRLLVKIVRDNLRGSDAIANSLVASGDFSGELARATADLDNVDTLDLGSHGSDFDKAYARSVAISEMVDDGVISLENVEWSKVFANDTTNVKKWHMADMWADRSGIRKTYGEFQDYLKGPNTESLFKLVSGQVFYSKRERVIQPFMKQAIPAHFEVGDHWKEWWGTDYNMSRAEKETLLHEAMINSIISPHAEHEMVLDHLGLKLKIGGRELLNIPGVDAIKSYLQWQEFFKHAGNEVYKRKKSLLFIFLWAIIATAFKSSFEEAKGK